MFLRQAGGFDGLSPPLNSMQDLPNLSCCQKGLAPPARVHIPNGVSDDCFQQATFRRFGSPRIVAQMQIADFCHSRYDFLASRFSECVIEKLTHRRVQETMRYRTS
jgi:hypothetical protein